MCVCCKKRQRRWAYITDVKPQIEKHVPWNQQHDKYVREKYKMQLCMLGTFEIILGILAVASSIVTIGFARSDEGMMREESGDEITDDDSCFVLTYISAGVWCGVASIICGVYGTRAPMDPTQRMYRKNVTASIVNAVFSSVQGGIATAQAALAINSAKATACAQAFIALLAFINLSCCLAHFGYACAGAFARPKKDKNDGQAQSSKKQAKPPADACKNDAYTAIV